MEQPVHSREIASPDVIRLEIGSLDMKCLYPDLLRSILFHATHSVLLIVATSRSNVGNSARLILAQRLQVRVVI